MSKCCCSLTAQTLPGSSPAGQKRVEDLSNPWPSPIRLCIFPRTNLCFYPPPPRINYQKCSCFPLPKSPIPLPLGNFFFLQGNTKDALFPAKHLHDEVNVSTRIQRVPPLLLPPPVGPLLTHLTSHLEDCEHDGPSFLVFFFFFFSRGPFSPFSFSAPPSLLSDADET